MNIEIGTHPFWDFSVNIYSRPGVRQACLMLQDRLGVDVSLVLFCVWWGATGRTELDLPTFQMIVDRATQWQEDVVRPFRQARRAAKNGAATLSPFEAGAVYRQMLSTELELERAEQLIIGRTADELAVQGKTTASAATNDGTRNLDLYFEMAGVVPGTEERDAAAVVIAAALSQSESDP